MLRGQVESLAQENEALSSDLAAMAAEHSNNNNKLGSSSSRAFSMPPLASGASQEEWDNEVAKFQLLVPFYARVLRAILTSRLSPLILCVCVAVV